MENLDYSYIEEEIKRRIDNGLVGEEDITQVTSWYHYMITSDVKQLVEHNAKCLMSYLNNNKIVRNDIDGTNYKIIAEGIFKFLEENNDLDEKNITLLKEYIKLLTSNKVSNEEKYEISEKFYRFKINIYFKKNSIEALNIINNKYNDNDEIKNKILPIINILGDDTVSTEERKRANIEIEEFLKAEILEKQINNHNRK